MHAHDPHLAGQDGGVLYPESDGKPMAENTRQARWIATLKGNLDARLPDFVAMDLFWYPVQGHPEIVQAPDVLVAIGRPKGDRSSYRQWEEEGVAPQVVFEILSPGNSLPEMLRKQAFYDRHGVEEYYIYDPDTAGLLAWLRQDGRLVEVPEVSGLVSPRLGIRYDLSGPELVVYGPEGERFLTFEELHARAREAEAALEAARQAEEAARQAEEAALARAEALAAKLRAMGVDPDAL